MQVHNRVSPIDNDDDDQKLHETKSAYEQLMHSLHHDPKWLEEINLGRRIGLYRIRGDLGSGNFSQVKMAMHQLTKEIVAIKMVDKNKLNDKTRRMLYQEIASMEQMHHPNIIRLYEVVETYAKVCLVTEYARCGDLFHKVTTSGRLEEPIAKHLFGQIASAVCHMHEKLIIHGDIKAENVFFSSPHRVKLGDFGFSVQLAKGHKQQLDMFCGSLPYAAPELLGDDPYLGGPVDIWALGVLLYYMMNGLMPFRGHTVPKIKEKILEGKIYMSRNLLSQEAIDLLERLLAPNPEERPTASEILESPWLDRVALPPISDQNHTYILQPTISPYKYPPEPVGTLEISDVEKVARERLTSLGINEALLTAHTTQGSRSHIMGCYRIMVHKIQRQMGVFYDCDKTISGLGMIDSSRNTTCGFSLCWPKSDDPKKNSSSCCTIM